MVNQIEPADSFWIKPALGVSEDVVENGPRKVIPLVLIDPEYVRSTELPLFCVSVMTNPASAATGATIATNSPQSACRNRCIVGSFVLNDQREQFPEPQANDHLAVPTPRKRSVTQPRPLTLHPGVQIDNVQELLSLLEGESRH